MGGRGEVTAAAGGGVPALARIDAVSGASRTAGSAWTSEASVEVVLNSGSTLARCCVRLTLRHCATRFCSALGSSFSNRPWLSSSWTLWRCAGSRWQQLCTKFLSRADQTLPS